LENVSTKEGEPEKHLEACIHWKGALVLVSNKGIVRAGVRKKVVQGVKYKKLKEERANISQRKKFTQ